MIRLHAPGLMLAAYLLHSCAASVEAERIGVPLLSGPVDDYVGYAITGLPAHFRDGSVAATDNTPVDNPITNAGATLGRVLFYDKRLSHNNSTSCASCHTQPTGFADPRRKSVGFDGQQTDRHSMALANATYYTRGRFFWDERAETLEEQVLIPIESAVEMGSDLAQVKQELAATAFYPALFNAAFGTPEITEDRMAQAMGQFVRSMVSYQSKFDRAYEAGTSDSPDFSAVFDPQELRGHSLFTGICRRCHITEAQVSFDPRNNGLNADSSDDPGAENGRFKAPSLRNVAERGRYMHDGRFRSLREVIEFYSTDIQPNPSLDARLRAGLSPIQFNFSEDDIDALIAFLETLSDTTFLTSGLFGDPFGELAGDFNEDGTVDENDLLVWQNTFGSNEDLRADANRDGIVDDTDLDIWGMNLGGSWNHPVPEPTLYGVLAVALVGILSRHRRLSRSTHRRA